MKYIRKVLAIGLAVIFLIAVVIGIGIIYSIRNVNVFYEKYTDEADSEYAVTRNNFDKLKGASLLFLSEEDVEKKISDTGLLSVISYEKKYPCSVDIVVRQRVETFAVISGGGYKIYDGEGKYIKSSNTNPSDLSKTGGEDVLIIAPEEDVADIAALCSHFEKSFGSLKRLVSNVSAKNILDVKVLAINLRGGLSISVSDWKVNGEAKIKEVRELYLTLSDNQKLGGVIRVYDGADGAEPVARYSQS